MHGIVPHSPNMSTLLANCLFLLSFEIVHRRHFSKFGLFDVCCVSNRVKYSNICYFCQCLAIPTTWHRMLIQLFESSSNSTAVISLIGFGAFAVIVCYSSILNFIMAIVNSLLNCLQYENNFSSVLVAIRFCFNHGAITICIWERVRSPPTVTILFGDADKNVYVLIKFALL